MKMVYAFFTLMSLVGVYGCLQNEERVRGRDDMTIERQEEYQREDTTPGREPSLLPSRLDDDYINREDIEVESDR